MNPTTLDPVSFLPLVWSIARRLKRGLPARVDVADLAQAGMIGMLDAIDRYDPGKNVKPTAFLSFRVRGAMMDFLRKDDHLARSARSKLKRLEAQGKPLGRMGVHLAPPRPLVQEDRFIRDRRTAGPSLSMETEDLLAWIRRHTGTRTAAIFRLRYIEGRSAVQIGKLLGLSDNYVWITLRNAKVRLRAAAAS